MRLVILIALCLAIPSSFGYVKEKYRIGELYEVGVGIGDVTGLSAGIVLMGYANPTQIGQGIHTRLFARTFIVKSGNDRVVFVSIDIGMIDTSIRRRVRDLLNQEFGDIYTLKNVLLSATHTHSGPGGYIQYAMYGIASMGFHKDNFETICQGIFLSIRKAHYSLQSGRISITSGEPVLGANINRSPASYDENPDAVNYEYNLDKTMTLIRIDSADGKELGTFNWFAVHPTSMNNTNRLVSGDNKGYASQLFENRKNPSQRPGKGQFVAAFASTNLGDASPNTEGPFCRGGPFAGQPCDPVKSTCGSDDDNDRVKWCRAIGPGENGDNVKSTEIIGELQFEEAWRLFHEQPAAFTPVAGPVQHAHEQINMNEFQFEFDGRTETTCKAALGYSFAAGTIDGPGMFNFTQGDDDEDEFWNHIRDIIREPDEDQKLCHEPKPILLDVGELQFPYDWAPGIVETQVLRIGNIYIVGVPGEFTTMSGRRMRAAVTAEIVSVAPEDPQPIVIIAGLSNLYTHYVATFEEYQIQRYEGASTLFGPRTLDAYIYQYSKQLARKMILGEDIPSGPSPPDLVPYQFSLLKDVVVDLPPVGYFIGQTKEEPLPVYTTEETVYAVFVSGHLRNNAMSEGSFLVVERLRDNGRGWDVVATDADWSTRIIWSRPAGRLGLDSEVEISWITDRNTPTGTYRIRHFGYLKPYQLDPVPYEGTSRTFQIQQGSYFQSFRTPRAQHERQDSPLVKFWKKLTNVRFFSN